MCVEGRTGAWTAVGAGAAMTLLFGTWVGRTQRAGSTVDPCARGGVELEDARVGPRSKAIISAMLAAIRSTVPWSMVNLPSSAATRETL
ncbi:hypothetical protein CDL15_Pgr026196 [Punica granatum]|uniref:Uncharacterized protein n=1 Tax=Punica granatum TaxID=22663 RepID=A0A218VSX7_PUNGR|nr:hypothetical protein CDL15_Pgr026196 [Punica granatum]